MNMLKKIIPLQICLFFLPFPLWAQGERYTEEEINVQKLYIEANREKLLRKYENAAYLFEEVTKKDRNNPAPYYELARVYDQLGESEKAFKNIKTAIKLDKNNLWYQTFLAKLHEKNEQDIEAAKIYEQLVQKDPKNEYYYYQWAYFLVKSGEGEKAIIVFDNLEAITGISEELATRKHKIYHQLGKRKNAAKELAKLADAFPQKLEHKHTLARYFEQIESRKNARAVYQQIIKLNPEDARARVALASFDTGSKKNDLGYLETLKELFKNPKTLIDVKIAKLYPYVKEVSKEENGATKNAILELAQLLCKMHPSEAKSFAIYGDLLYQLEAFEAALKQYQQALALDDTVFSLWENSMEIHQSLGQYEQLVDFSEKAIDLFPNRGASYYYNGWASNQKAKYTDAISAYNLALMMAGKNKLLALDIHIALGTAYANLKKYDLSDKAFEEAFKLNPKSLEAHTAYSYALAKRKEKLDKARKLAIIANELVENNAQAEKAMGFVYYQQEDFKNAQNWWQKAVEHSKGKDATILEHYGDALFQNGEVEVAISQWKKALEINKRSVSLQKKITNRSL